MPCRVSAFYACAHVRASRAARAFRRPGGARPPVSGVPTPSRRPASGEREAGATSASVAPLSPGSCSHATLLPPRDRTLLCAASDWLSVVGAAEICRAPPSALCTAWLFPFCAFTPRVGARFPKSAGIDAYMERGWWVSRTGSRQAPAGRAPAGQRRREAAVTRRVAQRGAFLAAPAAPWHARPRRRDALSSSGAPRRGAGKGPAEGRIPESPSLRGGPAVPALQPHRGRGAQRRLRKVWPT